MLELIITHTNNNVAQVMELVNKADINHIL